MTNRTRTPGGKAGAVTLASSLLVLTSVVASAQEQAQSQQPQMLEEIVVQGTRQSLRNAQDIKRLSDTFVDVISATDIGALPDRSILESIQRLPGVQMGRFAAANDPDHFGTEGSGLLIRGLKQIRSEFNGRDTFSASSDNGLSFQDVSPELMGSVVVSKNQTADMIEGGIGGTVSLNTRKPFDQEGMMAGFTIDGQASSIAEEWTPTFSGLFSNRWETELGEFGALISYANSELTKESHGMQAGRWELRPIEGVVSPETTPGFGYVPESSRYTYDGSFAGAPEGMAVGDEGVLVPHGVQFRKKTDEREREGIAASFQWESPNDEWLATAEFIRSDAQLAWTERKVGSEEDPSSQFNNPQWRHYGNVTGPGEDFQPEQWEFTDQGVFQSGTMSTVSEGWRSDANLRIPGNASWAAADVNEFGGQYRTETRRRVENRQTDDLSFNLKWTPNDSWAFEADYQHISAETNIDDNTLFFMTHANVGLSVEGTGTDIHMDLFSPWSYADPAERARVNEQLGEEVNIADPNYLQNESSYIFHAAQNFVERAEGEEDAFQLDGEHFFDGGGFFTSVKFGVRYADKIQRIGSTRYNYAPIQPAYQANPGWLNQEQIQDVINYDVVDWSNMEAGDSLRIRGNNTLLHPAIEDAKDWRNWSERFAPLVQDRCDTWRALPNRINADESEVVDGMCNNAGQYPIVDNYFRPDEFYITEEQNLAGYIRLDFESEIAGKRIAGNFGVRQVEIETTTKGSTQWPNLVPSYPLPDGVSITDDPTQVSQLYDDPSEGTNVPNGGDLDNDGLDDPRFWGDLVNYYSDDIRQFGNGASAANADTLTTTHTLPSLNVKFELTEDLLLRFALSKAISKPDIGKRRNYVQISEDNSRTTTSDPRAPFYGPEFNVIDNGGGAVQFEPVRDDSGNIVNVDPYPGIAADGPGGVVDQWNAYYINDDGTQGALVDEDAGIMGDGIPDIEGEASTPRQNLQEQRTFDPASVNYAGWEASAGNPRLKPAKADQVDLSLEWYFAPVGKLTGTVFYKDLEDFVTTGNFMRVVTNPVSGVSQNVRFTGPVNGDSATIEGIEIGYQQTYDFLPAPFDGLGSRINYSHIESEGIPNTRLNNSDPELGLDNEIAFAEALPLEGQSEDIANIVLFYQKNAIDARLAYNWNSEFLLTARDVITTLPVWNDAQGFLDASFKYNFTDSFQVGLEVKNLLDEEVVTRLQVDNNKKLFRSSFKQGRSFIVKASYRF